MTPDWSTLQAEVALPGSPGFDQLNHTFNTRFAVTPAAIVRCASAADVAATIGFVRNSGLDVVPRSGGHCFAGHSSTTGVVIDVTPMNGIEVDGDLAVIGAGARLGDVYDALGSRAIPAGTCPTVGIAGLTLGGGLGVLGRRHGLTSDSLVAAEIVLADGRVVACDGEQHADLFWALRGGGAGTLGVVTSFTFRTVPAPHGTNFHLSWPFESAATVIEAWQSWAPTAPDEVYASLKITAGDGPPSVDLYAFLQGDGELTLDAPPPRRTWAETMPFPETRAFWAALPTVDEPEGEPADQVHFISRSEYFRQPLPPEAISALLACFTQVRVPRELDFMPWGGAFNRLPIDATAFPHRSELFQLKHSATAPTDWVTESWTTVHPWASGGVFPNFPDPDLDDPLTAYYGPNLPRLQEVKARYDPTDIFSL